MNSTNFIIENILQHCKHTESCFRKKKYCKKYNRGKRCKKCPKD